MIQRIQTLYLLAIVILGIVLIWLPVVEFISYAEIYDKVDNFHSYGKPLYNDIVSKNRRSVSRLRCTVYR